MAKRVLKCTPKFEKAYRKFVRRHAVLQKRIDDTLRQMENDVFSPSLEAHKLSGKLFGLFACSCGYDCRIINPKFSQNWNWRFAVLIVASFGKR